MKRAKVLVLAAMLSSSALASVATDASKPEATKTLTRPPERCGVLYKGEDGELASVLLPSLAVLTLQDDEVFALPKDAPAQVQVVQCGRNSIVPQRNDYKVLAAGLPFSIVSGGRVGVLVVTDGHLQFQMLEGEMTPAEQPQVGAFLDQAQDALNKAMAPAPKS
jgi:hypothetical protein